MEIIGSIVSQLTTGEGAKSFDRYGVGAYYMDHANAVYPANAGGVPFTAAYLQSKADPLADLHEDLAAEQKARATYDNILRVCDDPDVSNVIKFLREREVVHFQRFGEAKREVSSKYPGSGKPTPAPFCNRKTKIQKMYELKPDLGVLLPTSNAPFSFHK